MSSMAIGGYAPCPKCGSTTATPVTFTWWGGILGPRLLHHVQCTGCGAQFDGTTGQSNTTRIVLYCLVVLIVMFVAMAATGSGS